MSQLLFAKAFVFLLAVRYTIPVVVNGFTGRTIGDALVWFVAFLWALFYLLCSL